MNKQISIRLKCFSIFRQALGKETITMQLPAEATGIELEKSLRALLKGQYEGIPLLFAVNQEFVPKETHLKDGDEVALIPPMQGG